MDRAHYTGLVSIPMSTSLGLKHPLTFHPSLYRNVPLNAVLVSLTVTSLLSLINIGSTAALNAILALTTCSLLTSYMIVIGCVLLKRIRGQPLPGSHVSRLMSRTLAMSETLADPSTLLF